MYAVGLAGNAGEDQDLGMTLCTSLVQPCLNSKHITSGVWEEVGIPQLDCRWFSAAVSQPCWLLLLADGWHVGIGGHRGAHLVRFMPDFCPEKASGSYFGKDLPNSALLFFSLWARGVKTFSVSCARALLLCTCCLALPLSDAFPMLSHIPGKCHACGTDAVCV